MYDVLNNAVAAEVTNGNRPKDDTLQTADCGVLERYVEPIMAALRACGASPDTVDQKPLPEVLAKRKVYKESVKDLIDARLLKPETRLHPLRKDLTRTALVLHDGRLQVGDRPFPSVSSAAQAVSGNKAEPGWDFWGAPSGDGGFVSLFELRRRLRGDIAPNGGTPTADAEVELPGEPPEPSAPPVAPPPPRPRPPTPPPSPDPLPEMEDGPPLKRPRRFAVSVVDLLQAGLLAPGEELRSVRKASADVRARLRADGHVEVGGETHGSLSRAAIAVSGNVSEPGWKFWTVERDGARVTLYQLREQLLARRTAAPE